MSAIGVADRTAAIAELAQSANSRLMHRNKIVAARGEGLAVNGLCRENREHDNQHVGCQSHDTLVHRARETSEVTHSTAPVQGRLMCTSDVSSNFSYRLIVFLLHPFRRLIGALTLVSDDIWSAMTATGGKPN